jgi:glycosyltransferase involved in cell wall biosynthesis
MKICLINSQFDTDSPSGARNYVHRVSKKLQDRSHEVSILTTEPYNGTDALLANKTTEDGLDVYRFYPANVSHRGDGTGSNILTKGLWHGIDSINPHSKRVAGRLFDRLDPDVIHTNNLVGISPAVARAAASSDARHVHTLHDYSLICPRSNLLRKFTAPEGERTVCEDPPTPCRLLARQKRRMIGQPDIVTGLSQHVIDTHLKHGFFNNCSTKRILLGTESVLEAPPPIPDDPSILFVGKQDESKGIGTLLDAAPHMPDVTIHICGSGPHENETERRAATLDNVRYHGYVSNDRLKQLRQASTAAIVPSIWMEVYGITIVEAFSMGLPVIGSDIGGIPELVEDGERGYTFTPKSVDDLVAAVERVLDHDPSMRERVLSWARGHTLADHVDQLERLYS